MGNSEGKCPKYVSSLGGNATTPIPSRPYDKEQADQGDKHFSARDYDAAIDCYTKAIIKEPDMAHYYTKRASCYLRQKKWLLAAKDSYLSIDLDPNLMKSHYYLGQALLAKGGLDEAIAPLQRAKDMAKKQMKHKLVDDITKLLRIVRTKKTRRKVRMQSYLNRQLLKDRRRIEEAKKTAEDHHQMVETEHRLALLDTKFTS